MLRHTFCHAKGVGPQTERRLWAEGVRSWDDLSPTTLRGVRAPRLGEVVEASRTALEARDARWFARALPSRESWRLFDTFRERTAYLDIETTGLGFDAEVTAIALWDGRRARSYVQGRNLDQFELDVAGYDLLVTYNGAAFDLPMLRRALGVRLDQAHVDLMFVLRALGQAGGLKAIERRLGYGRADLADVDGACAVVLWDAWRRTRSEAVLETLVAYNVQDVLTLEPLMVWAFNRKLEETPFAELALPSPGLAPNPYRAHREVIERLRVGQVA